MRPGWVAPAIIGIGMTLVATIILARSPAQELEHRAIAVVDLPPEVDDTLDELMDGAGGGPELTHDP